MYAHRFKKGEQMKQDVVAKVDGSDASLIGAASVGSVKD